MEWLDWNQAQALLLEAVQPRREAKTEDKASGLQIVVFGEKWDPVSIEHCRVACSDQVSRSLPLGTSVLCVDATSVKTDDKELQIVALPCSIFYWHGKRVLIRRNGWSDDYKFVGPLLTKELLEIALYVMDAGGRGENTEKMDQLVVSLPY